MQSLSDYVYKSAHTEMLKRRCEWFERVEQMYQVLWWVPAGHRPSVVEAAERLAYLREHDATEQAFILRQPFSRPEVETA